MVRAVCPLCGRAVDRLIDGLCPQCYRANHPLIQQKREIALQRCRICGAYRHGNSAWIQEVKALEEEMKRRINSFLVFKGRVNEIQLRVRPDRRILEIRVTGLAHGLQDEPHSEDYTIPIKLRETICDTCMKHVAKRSIATVQIRADARELTKEERNNVEEVLATLLKDSRKSQTDRVPIKVEEAPHGIDIHFATYAAAREFVRLLSERMFFDVLETSKIIGITHSGREKHKQTIRLLLPKFKKGDVVELKEHLYLVEDIRASKAILLDLEKSTKITIPLSRSSLENINIYATSEDLEHGIIISRYENIVHVMSTADDTILEVEVKDLNAANLAPGCSVMILKRGERVYLISRESKPKQ